MKQQNQGSWKDRWRQQWLEAQVELLWQRGLAEGLMAQLEQVLEGIEAQTALVNLYAAMAEEDDEMPP